MDNEKMDKAKAKLDKLITERIDAMMRLPARQLDLSIPGDSKGQYQATHFDTRGLDRSPILRGSYKGYDLANQGMQLKFINPDLKEGYCKWMINLIHSKAPMQEDSVTEGGYLVPEEYEAEVIGFLRDSSAVLANARIFNTTTNVMRVPLEDGAVSVYDTAEEVALTASNPTVGEAAFEVRKIGAYATASNELLQDSNIDLPSWLTGLFTEALAKQVDYNAFYGANSWCPMLSGGDYEVQVSGADTTFSPEYGSEAIAQLDAHQAVGGKFYIGKDVLHALRIAKDTAGAYSFQKPGEGATDTLWTYPIVVSSQMPTAAAGTADYFGGFANLQKGYGVAIRKGMAIEVDPYGLFLEYQTRYRFVARMDGQCMLTEALVGLYAS